MFHNFFNNFVKYLNINGLSKQTLSVCTKTLLEMKPFEVLLKLGSATSNIVIDVEVFPNMAIGLLILCFLRLYKY